MSTFEIKAYKVKVEDHPNADKLDIVKLESQEYVCIAQKGLYQNGDIALYIPTNAIVPEHILKPGFWDETKQKGILAGSLGNRVKPKRLRGIFSEGILIRPITIERDRTHYYVRNEETNVNWILDFEMDYAEFLGIKKYEPSVPQNMRVKSIGEFLDLTINYDFDSIKKDPNMFYGYEIVEYQVEHEGRQIVNKKRNVLLDQPESVSYTEKIHGTLLMIGLAKRSLRTEKMFGGNVYFSSKGLAKRGIILDHTDQENVYVKAATRYKIFDILSKMDDFCIEGYNEMLTVDNASFLIIGEVFGKGVQDLEYVDDIDFRLFDIAIVKTHTNFFFLEDKDLMQAADSLGLPFVPMLKKGPFDPAILAVLTDGKETVSGKEKHIREGVVIKGLKNFFDERSARFMRNAAKSISEAYHERKGNVTEYQ